MDSTYCRNGQRLVKGTWSRRERQQQTYEEKKGRRRDTKQRRQEKAPGQEGEEGRSKSKGKGKKKRRSEKALTLVRGRCLDPARKGIRKKSQGKGIAPKKKGQDASPLGSQIGGLRCWPNPNGGRGTTHREVRIRTEEKNTLGWGGRTKGGIILHLGVSGKGRVRKKKNQELPTIIGKQAGERKRRSGNDPAFWQTTRVLVGDRIGFPDSSTRDNKTAPGNFEHSSPRDPAELRGRKKRCAQKSRGSPAEFIN